MPNLRILDAHAHIGYVCDGYETHVDELVSTMDRLGIEKMLASSFEALYADPVAGNAFTLACACRHPGRLYAYLCVNPHHTEGVVSYLDESLLLPGVVGIKLHPDFNAYPPDGPAYQRVYAYAEKRGAVVLNHTFGSARTFVQIASDYPNLKMIAAHAVYPSNKEDIAYLAKNLKGRRNLLLDTASSCLAAGAIEYYAEAFGASMISFGSDIPYLDGAYQVGRFIYGRLKPADKERILYHNAAAMFDGLL